MITTTDLSNWLGIRLTQSLDSTQLQAALDDGNRYCLGYMEARNSNAVRGSSFDDAVFCIAKASILRQLDAMGIKPAGLSMGGSMSVSSDVSEAVNQLMKRADASLGSAFLFSSKGNANLFMHRNRGGQGI